MVDLPDGVAPEAIRALTLSRVRELMRDAQREENDLSYLRRLLQGRIDILRAELARRAGRDGAEPTSPVVGRLPEILSESRPPTRGARHVNVQPPRTDRYRSWIEQLLADVGLSDLAAHTDAELGEALDKLGAHEQEVSSRRHRLQRTADDCAAEITRRYREGEAKVDDLLSGR
ncbi:hypothetical protein [Embleya scabrispora]|uniref:RsiG family protein n=1 Tax=Embleya scabrispora TaxID=159449 RepID=UPI00035DEF21|nr:hypothetical protein [Embleya scabrispora]MYS79904.1 ABC transporter substrate-binding protein [Streptomyces sp. SID5474]